jgi:hypothetical protein
MTQPTTAVTQRAYTLRLRCRSGKCAACGKDDCRKCWSRALWETHKAVNAGANVFGEWLLTLRGGLDHKLAETANHQQRKLRRVLLALSWLSVEDERGAPASDDLIVAYGDKCERARDNQESRNRKVEAALRQILAETTDDANEINAWVADCEGSFKVAIREDAVRVNRRACFDRENQRLDGALTDDAVWDLLKPVFRSPQKMLAPAALGEDEDQTRAVGRKPTSDRAATDRAKAAPNDGRHGSEAEDTAAAKDFVIQAGHWVSSRWGTGPKSDSNQIDASLLRIVEVSPSEIVGKTGSAATVLLCDVLGAGLPDGADPNAALATLKQAVGWKGHPSTGEFALRELAGHSNVSQAVWDDVCRKLQKALSKEKQSPNHLSNNSGGWTDHLRRDVEDHSGIPFRTPSVAGRTSDNTKEYAVMLDHAMRRVSITHSWIKRAEAARAKFATDCKRIDDVPRRIREWLDDFFWRRGGDTNANEGYSVRRRALGGKHAKAWKAVVARWMTCASENERRDAVGAIQSEWDDDEKFGHSELFIALAAEEAADVWKVGPEALIDYVTARDAETRARHYKVPAYRHPDAYHNPVFVDFGYSRWRVEYAAHMARHRVLKAERGVQQKREHLASQSNEKHKEKAQSALKAAEKRLNRIRAEFAAANADSIIRLRLWDGQEFRLSDELSGGITWHSARLRKDVIMAPTNDHQETGAISRVARADRHGRAAAGAKNGSVVEVSNVFEEDHWNARLQLPRRALLKIAKQLASGKTPTLLKWFVTLSSRLRPQPNGPFLKYERENDKSIQPDTQTDRGAKLISLAPKPSRRKRDEWRGLAYPFKRREYEDRSGHAKILLSRLPKLRILSVDLGHRFAAACAVWETLSLSVMREEIEGRKIIAGGMAEGDLYCHTSHTAEDGKQRTTIYRRIAADKLEDGSDNSPPHPAPWARLERQFFIKLQGEERPARMASKAEYAYVQELEKTFGRERGAKKPLPWQVDELMAEAVRSLRLALRRHGDTARIAFGLVSEYKFGSPLI